MKGAKGGLRDQKITEAYRKKNNSSFKEEQEAILNHRKKDGLNLNKDENGICDLKSDAQEGENNKEIIVIKGSKEEEIPKVEMDFELKKEITNEAKENKSAKIPIEEKQEESLPQEIKQDVIEKVPKKHVGTNVEEKEINIMNQEEIHYEQEKIIEVQEAESIYDEQIETVNVKDTNEEELEKKIVLEFENMLKKDYYEIKDLEYELKVLSQQEEDIVLQEEVDDLKIKIETLLDKFDQIKKKYETLKDTKNFSNVVFIDNYYLTNLINNYKKEVQDNIVISDLIKRVKETEDYIGIIERIVYIESEQENLAKKVEDKKETLEYRDTNFEILEKKYNDVEKINIEIEAFHNTLNSILKDMQNKIDYMGNISEKKETYTRIVPDMNRLFRAMVQLITSSMIPRTRTGNVVKTGLVVGAIRNLSHSLRRERTTETKQIVEFTNYEKDILKNMTSIDDFMKKLNDASKTIQDIKQTFKKEILEYVSFISEFKELMENIETIEKELEEKNYYLEKYNHEMKSELDRNNTKVMLYKNI